MTFFTRTIRLRLESGTMVKEVTVVQCCNWPQQCSPLSTVFDLIKQVTNTTLHGKILYITHMVSNIDSYCESLTQFV